MNDKQFMDRLTEISINLSALDVEIQQLIKKSWREGTLEERKEDLQELIFEMYGKGQWLLEALDDPSMIQPYQCL